MYLSRVELNLSSRETMLALDNLNKFHGAVESSFDSNRTHRNLWRIDDLNGKTENSTENSKAEIR